MTILFSDVRGFTTISEIYKDDPQGLTTLMNNFLTPMTNAIGTMLIALSIASTLSALYLTRYRG